MRPPENIADYLGDYDQMAAIQERVCLELEVTSYLLQFDFLRHAG